MDDVRAVMEKAEKHLAAAATLYEADLGLQRVSPTLRGKVKAFLESERTALDNLARRLVGAGAAGDSQGRYPLAADPTAFDAALDEHLPGLRDARPDVAAALARHQPFTVPALGLLGHLAADERCQHLTPETLPAPHVDTPPPPPPAEPEASKPAPAQPPSAAGLGAGLTGPLMINGFEYDPVTLQPLNATAPPPRETVYVAWLFHGRDHALQTLEAISAAVAAAVEDITAVAGLP